MSEDVPEQGSEARNPPMAGDMSGFMQDVRHSQVSARVPERVSRGVFATGLLVLQSPHEFVLDFLQRLGQPQQLAARVAVPFTLMPGLIEALQNNLSAYQRNFGAPPSMPPPPANVQPPRIEEVYDALKIADELLSGAYANGVIIAHTRAEFCFDFVTNFYPRSAVSARVYVSSFHVTRILESLSRSWMQYQRKQGKVDGGQ